jgi:hypothetical protein
LRLARIVAADAHVASTAARRLANPYRRHRSARSRSPTLCE